MWSTFMFGYLSAPGASLSKVKNLTISDATTANFLNFDVNLNIALDL